MATSKAKYPYIDLEASDVETRDGDRFTAVLVNDKPYAGGKYEYNAPGAPDAGGGRGFINPPMAKRDYSGKMVVGKPGDITPAERKKLKRDMKMASDPVSKAKGGKVGSASARADGCAQRGKTRGKMV
jgi:hypothetical protein